MKLIPTKTRVNNEDALGVAIEFTMITAVFFGAGWLVDNWLGTVPLFMIVFSVLAGVGLFTKSKYRYDAKMERLDAERRAGRTTPATEAPPASESKVV
jgi:F0F1-type ATP synthase assembly protein I